MNGFLKNVLNIGSKKVNSSAEAPILNSVSTASEEDLIDDSDILSNPFFTTLKPLD